MIRLVAGREMSILRLPIMMLKSLCTLVVLFSLGTAFGESNWSDAPTGSLLGRGYTKSGPRLQSSTALAGRLRSEDPALRTSLLKLDSRAGTVVEGISLMPEAVAQQIKVPAQQLMTEARATGLTFAELLVAHSIAGADSKSFSSLLAARKAGRSWTALAQQAKISPASIARRADAAESSLRFAQSRRDRRREQNVRDEGIGGAVTTGPLPGGN